MRRLKRGYTYLFYKFYKLSEAAPSRWWSEWKASLAMDALCIWTFGSIVAYYVTATKTILEFGTEVPYVWIIVVPIFLFNYFTFHHRDRWKAIVRDFDKLDQKKKDRIGSWIVFGVVFFIITNLVFSFYLMNRVDWTKYE